MELAIPTEVLTDYLNNVVHSQGFRAIARGNQGHASTVLRRARRCEDLRDHPEWDALFDAIESYWAATSPRPKTLTPDGVLVALGLKKSGLIGSLKVRRNALTLKGGAIATSDAFPVAVIVDRDQRLVSKLDRKNLLAALAFGWVKPINEGQKVRLFSITDQIPLGKCQVHGEWKRYQVEPVIDALARLHNSPIDPPRLKAARDFQLLAAQGSESARYLAFKNAVPESLFRALECLVTDNMGITAFEAQEGYPARSGKVVLALALDSAIHAGIAV